MLKGFARWWWVPGYLVVLIGCFYLTLGLASWGRGPDFVDGVLTGALCLVAGGVILRQRARKARRNLEDREHGAEPDAAADRPRE